MARQECAQARVVYVCVMYRARVWSRMEMWERKGALKEGRWRTGGTKGRGRGARKAGGGGGGLEQAQSLCRRG